MCHLVLANLTIAYLLICFRFSFKILHFLLPQLHLMHLPFQAGAGASPPSHHAKAPAVETTQWHNQPEMQFNSGLTTNQAWNLDRS